MSGHEVNSVTGEYQRLFRVPKSALIDFIIQNRHLGEPLEQALSSICGLSIDITPNDLATHTHTKIVLVIQHCSAFTIEQVRDLYNQYLYREMKTLYLHEYLNPSESPASFADIPQLNMRVQQVTEKLKNQISNFRNLTFKDLEVVETSVGPVYELPYSYIAFVQVVDPKDEYPILVDDLRRGFVWISPEHGWMAVCARDQITDRIISQSIIRHTGADIRFLPIPKAVLKQLESMESIRRLSLINHATNTRRRWTNSEMSKDQTAMDEIQVHDAQDETTACGYNQVLSDGTTFALGYSNSQGRIFFSRELTVSQLRDWGPQKTTLLVDTLRKMLASNPAQVVSSLAVQVLPNLQKETKQAIVKIAESILYCITNGVSEADLGVNPFTAYEHLRSYTDLSLLADCQYCQEPTEIVCAHCGSSNLAIINDELECKDCGTIVSKENVTCFEGHSFEVNDILDIIVLTPKTNLLDSVNRLIEASAQQFSIVKDRFHIRGSRLHYSQPGGYLVYTIDDIPELAELLVGNPSNEETGLILKHLGNFKEKCDNSTIEKCAKCVAERQGGPCYLRLFGLFDPKYTPYPHQGGEFGDYSRAVTLDDQHQNLVLAMKAGKPSKQTLKLRADGLGTDIYTQIRTYLADGNIGVLGISVPRRLDERFLATLRRDVELHKKRILVINDESLARIVYSVMNRNSLALDEI